MDAKLSIHLFCKLEAVTRCHRARGGLQHGQVASLSQGPQWISVSSVSSLTLTVNNVHLPDMIFVCALSVTAMTVVSDELSSLEIGINWCFKSIRGEAQ